VHGEIESVIAVGDDFGVLAIVGSLVLQGLTSHRDLNHDETQTRRDL